MFIVSMVSSPGKSWRIEFGSDNPCKFVDISNMGTYNRLCTWEFGF